MNAKALALDSKKLSRQLVEWRRHLHAHPELSGEEAGTSSFVAEKLEEIGVPFIANVGGYGIVASLSREGSDRSVGLRADMDALPILEATNLPYASRTPGVMHACGHDGHTVCLLGAAAILAADASWAGTVRFVFQPAEEAGTGARAMLADGLLDRFPVDRFFAFHNWPGVQAGTVAVRPGIMMATTGRIRITLRGEAAHAAMPHRARDPLHAAAQLIIATQSIVSREIDAQDSAVISICVMNAGSAINQIPDEVTLGGIMRLHRPELREHIEASLRRVCEGIAEAFAVEVDCQIERGSQACINTDEGAEIAQQAAVEAGFDMDPAPTPSMGGEDFSAMLSARGGALAWIGNGPATGGRGLHSPHYDFNDDILPVGAQWLANVARLSLSH